MHSHPVSQYKGSNFDSESHTNNTHDLAKVFPKEYYSKPVTTDSIRKSRYYRKYYGSQFKEKVVPIKKLDINDSSEASESSNSFRGAHVK